MRNLTPVMFTMLEISWGHPSGDGGKSDSRIVFRRFFCKSLAFYFFILIFPSTLNLCQHSHKDVETERALQHLSSIVGWEVFIVESHPKAVERDFS